MKNKLLTKINGFYLQEASVTIYTKFFHKEIGTIHVTCSYNGNEYCIQYFQVREKYRNKGIGRKLIEAMKKEVAKDGGTSITVYPYSFGYEGDSTITTETLYTIYQHLGFQFKSENVDKKASKHLMYINI